MFLRILAGLMVCMVEATGDGAGTGGGNTSGGAGGQTTSTTQQTSSVDVDKVKAEAAKEGRAAARAEFLKEQGFPDEESYKKHLDQKKKDEDAKLSENERTKKLYNEALDARGKAEADVEKHKAEAKAAREALALRDRLDTHGVLPKERKFVEVALEEAEAQAKKDGKPHDDAKFFEGLRKERPYFFSKDASTPANTSPNAPAPGSNAPQGNGLGNLKFDASKLSPEEWAKWRAENIH